MSEAEAYVKDLGDIQTTLDDLTTEVLTIMMYNLFFTILLDSPVIS